MSISNINYAHFRHKSNLNNVQVGRKVNGGIITYVNADNTGRYWGKQRYSNCAGSGCSSNNIFTTSKSNSGFSYGYTMKRSNYLAGIDINDYREHCTSAAAWTSIMVLFSPLRLTALYDDNNQSPAPMGKQKKIVMCFRGFGCESRTYKYEYTVQRGCPAGKYENPNVRWLLKRTDKNNPNGNNGYQDYCITCPAGRYTDPSDIAQQPALSINDCKQCPEGKFGDEENSPNRDGASYCVTCPAGRYGGTKGLSDATCTGLCLPGYYCPAVTATQTELNEKATGGAIGKPNKEVVASRFGNFGALTDQGSGVCPAGYYCPSGSGSETCVSGTNLSPTNQRCKHQCIDGANCGSFLMQHQPDVFVHLEARHPAMFDLGITQPEKETTRTLSQREIPRSRAQRQSTVLEEAAAIHCAMGLNTIAQRVVMAL